VEETDVNFHIVVIDVKKIHIDVLNHCENSHEYIRVNIFHINYKDVNFDELALR
jgi:hypothetical protein